MLNVRELIRELEKMPGDAKVLAHVKELGGFIRIEKADLKDGKMFEGQFGKLVVILDEKPFVPRKEQEEETETEEELENLCPECSFFCEERFTDGQCK